MGFFPVILLMFIPQAEIHNWGVVALAAIYQYIFAFLALMLLTKQNWPGFAGAAILAFLTTFTFGNGMFIFISGYLVLSLSMPRNIKRFVWWTVVMIISVGLYFTDFNFSSGVGFKPYFLEHPFLTMQYLLIFFGSIFHSFFYGNVVLLTVSGFVVLSSFGLLLLFKWKEVARHPVALAIMLFVVLAAGAAAVNRVSMGTTTAIAYRYVMYQAVFLAMFYVIALNIWKNNLVKFLIPVIIASCLLYAWRLELNQRYFENHNSALKDQLLCYHTDYRLTNSSTPKSMKEILDKSQALGIYTPPSIDELYPNYKNLDLVFPSDYSGKILYNLDLLNHDSTFLEINGWAFAEEYLSKKMKTGVVLKSGSLFFTFIAQPTHRKDVKRHFARQYPALGGNAGFEIRLEKRSRGIPDGNYQLGIGIIQDGAITHLKFTGKEISFY